MLTTAAFLESTYKNEQQMTALCYKWINHNYPESRGLFFHVANEMPDSDAKYRAQMVSQGLVPGIPDFVCWHPKLAIELKMPTGSLSPNQRIIHKIWKESGEVYICKSLLEFYNVIVKHFGKPKDVEHGTQENKLRNNSKSTSTIRAGKPRLDHK